MKKIPLTSYLWSGINAQGKQLTGEIHAVTPNAAKINLKSQGISAHYIRKKSFFILPKFIKKIPALDIALFFRQLATLISAGIPIVQSCVILAKGSEKKSLQLLIHDLKAEIETGKEFASGLRKHPHYFDSMTCHLIQIGEQTGKLDTMLTRIAQHKEKMLALKNQITQALLYPSIIMLVALTVSVVMLTFVVPKFEDLFQSMHGKLPAFTVFVIYVSKLIRQGWWLIFLFIISGFIFLYYYKEKIDHWIIKIPLIGLAIQKIILARFARSLATAFAAGTPITDALKLIAHTSGNQLYLKAIQQLQIDIEAGRQLHAAMQSSYVPLFPPMMIQMIRIGEESGMLDTMLEKIAHYYESDVDNWVGQIGKLLEPLIMVFLGVLIGGLVIAMYLPIFKLGTLI